MTTVATVSSDSDFVVTEGQGFATTIVSFSGTGSGFSWSWEITTDGGTATEDFPDYDLIYGVPEGEIQPRSFGFGTGTGTADFDTEIPISAKSDQLDDAGETFFVIITLTGDAVFEDGTQEIVVEWTIDEIGSIYGTPEDDALFGTEDDSFVYAYGGDDVFYGGVGAETIFGGEGNDLLNGGDGNDRLEGGDGFDILEGGPGDDLILGSSEFNLVFGGEGSDVFEFFGAQSFSFDHLILTDRSGVETIKGNGYLGNAPYTPDMVGTNANNYFNLSGVSVVSSVAFISMLDGDDLAVGSQAGDLIDGDAGNDRLIGYLGNDQIYGGTGDDIVAGGRGDDDMWGNQGSDVFVFVQGQDTIGDFEIGQDYLYISAQSLPRGVATGSDVLANATVSNGDTILDFGALGTLTLEGVTTPASLDGYLYII